MATSTIWESFLRAHIAQYKSQREAATALKISPQFLSDLLTGRREPGSELLEKLGLRRVVLYEVIDKK
jgi:transcriptional regulator with XRE-family HTH domain